MESLEQKVGTLSLSWGPQKAFQKKRSLNYVLKIKRCVSHVHREKTISKLLRYKAHLVSVENYKHVDDTERKEEAGE